MFNPLARIVFGGGRVFRRSLSSSAAFGAIPSSAPRVVQPSTWEAIVPRFLRQNKKQQQKEWNPATFYIVMYLLIGSNAINMIALRTNTTTFSRKADVEIAKLREVLKRVQEGEDVDVESILGTGDEEKEKEWQKIIEEFENDPQISNAEQQAPKPDPPKAREPNQKPPQARFF